MPYEVIKLLILPIVNKDRVLNVLVTLRGAEKVRSGVSIDGVSESDIIVNGRCFSKSSFADSKDPLILVEFIRNNLVAQNKFFSVTTKTSVNSDLCDVYQVNGVPIRGNDIFDRLYAAALLDMQKETPNNLKGKYLSFKRVGLGDVFSDEKVSRMKKIIDNVDSSSWMSFFKDDGLVDMLQMLDLLNLFDFTVVGGATISEDTFKGVLTSFAKISSKDTKSLNNYYNMAVENSDIYAKMSYVSKMIYDKPFNLIQSSNQRNSVQFVKGSERELSQVA